MLRCIAEMNKYLSFSVMVNEHNGHQKPKFDLICVYSLIPIYTVPYLCSSAEDQTLRVRSFGMIRKRITDPRSRCIKGTDESTLGKDSSVPLMHHDPSDLGSVSRFRIIPKERTLK